MIFRFEPGDPADDPDGRLPSTQREVWCVRPARRRLAAASAMIEAVQAQTR